MILAALLLLAAAEGPAPASHAGPLDKALEAAAAADRPLLVVFRKADSGACAYADREVLGDPAAVRACEESLVVYRVEEGKGEGSDLCARFGVKDFPCFLFLDGEGNELERQAGPVGKAFFLEMAGEVAEGVHCRGLRRRVEQRPDDAALRARLGKRLFLRGDPGATVHLERAVELDPKKEKESTKEAAFLLEVQVSIPAGTVPSLRAFVEKYPDCGRAMEVHRALARALEERKDHEGEIPSCEVLHLRAPDAETRNGLAWVLAKAGKDAARALALVDEALREKPESAAFMDTRAECLSRLGRHDEAVALQKKAMEVLGGSAPKDVRTLYEEHLKELEKRRDEARK